MIAEFMALAETLVARDGDQSHGELRRAVSTAYYALFHAFADDAATLFTGARTRDDDAWTRVYRALEHGSAIKACRQVKDQDFGAEITRCAVAFARLQDARHSADYDPLLKLTLGEARFLVDAARSAIDDLCSAVNHERQRFAVYLLFKVR